MRRSKCLVEIDAPQIDRNLHRLQQLHYDKATTMHAPRQDFHTIQAMSSSLDTIVDLDSENTKSLLHRRYKDENIRKYRHTMVTELPYTSVLTHVSGEEQDPRPVRAVPPPPNHLSSIPAPSIGLKFPPAATRSSPSLETMPQEPSGTPPSSHDHPQRCIGMRPAQWKTNEARHVSPQHPHSSGYLDGHEETNVTISANRHQRMSRLLGHPQIGRPSVHPSTPRETSTRI